MRHFLTFFLLYFFTTLAFAKIINLYEEPKKDSKMIGKIDSESGFVPIFTSKAGDWMKVGDPKNGNVGWIQSSDLSTSNGNITGFTFSQRVVNSDKGPQSYVVQFGTPKPISSKEAQNMIKQMEARQQQIQKEMQKMMQDVFGNTWTAMPVVMPILVIPTQDIPKKTPQQKNNS